LGAVLVRWGWWIGFAWVAGLLLFAGVDFAVARTRPG